MLVEYTYQVLIERESSSDKNIFNDMIPEHKRELLTKLSIMVQAKDLLDPKGDLNYLVESYQ